MKVKILFLLVLVIALLFGSCQKEPVAPGPKPIELDQKSKSLLESDNAFAFEIFREIVETEENSKNIMISPLSISLALAMTYNGADGETKEAMENVLHLQGLSTDDINKSYQSLINALLSVDPKVIMEIANSIWYKEGFPVEEEFLNINRTYYDAEVTGLDFTNPASVDIINQWVSDKTHEKIDKIIEVINPLDIMFLINAIYFKGTWKYEFDKNDTQESPFYDETGDFLKNAQMMTLEGDLNYTYNDLFQAIELPYGQGNYSMIIMLPQSGVSVDSLVNNMNDNIWKTWMNGLYKRTNFRIFIPKFKFKYEKELKDALCQLGMGIAFSDLANFSKINPDCDLLISSVKHKTFIEVNEEGTEAAAVTAVTVGTTIIGPSSEFRADHPFIFIIKEKYTEAIMFMGKIAAPETGD